MSRTILAAMAVWISAASFSAAVTIPAGTHLLARTVQPVSSHERVGTPFQAELERDVVVNGKVLLRAGTPVSGVVEGSLHRAGPKSDALRLNLKTITIHGRSVPVHTTGSYRLDRHTTSRGVSVSGRDWNFPYHTRLVFHLAQPLNW